MRFYSTSYEVQDPSDPVRKVKFSSCIYAKSFRHACQLAIKRNIGELVLGVVKSSQHDPCPLPSAFYMQRQMLDCLHTLIFYGWIASMGKLIDLREMCNDLGMLHEIMHEMHHPSVYGFRQDIFDRMVNLESLVPGLKTYKHIHDTKVTMK